MTPLGKAEAVELCKQYFCGSQLIIAFAAQRVTKQKAWQHPECTGLKVRCGPCVDVLISSIAPPCCCSPGTGAGSRIKVMRHLDFGYHNKRHQPVFSDYDRSACGCNFVHLIGDAWIYAHI